MLDISVGETSMKRKKEKQLPLSPPERIKRAEFKKQNLKKKKRHLRRDRKMKKDEIIKARVRNAHLSGGTETAECDLERKETAVLVVI